MHKVRRPTDCFVRKAASPFPYGRGGGGFAGVEVRGMRACGFPGNPGDLFISISEQKPYDGNRLDRDPEAASAAPGIRRIEDSGAQMVLPSEGNEVRQDG